MSLPYTLAFTLGHSWHQLSRLSSEMSVPAPHQSPVILQRQHSSHHHHQRQPSSTSRHAGPPSRGGDNGGLNLSARDAETSRLMPTSTGGSHRPMPATTASGTSGTNGTSSHVPPAIDDPRQLHHMQRSRKTSIHGPSGTWNLGKTIGAGSMGKVKLARKADGSEQVCNTLVVFI